MSAPLSPIDLLDLVMPSDVQVSPDGSQCAFVLSLMDRQVNQVRSSIWVAPADASAAARRLTAGPRRDLSPRWSPDGRWLAFLSNRELDWRPDLYVIDLRGGEPRRVAGLPRGIEDFAWSVDSTRFALLGRPEYPADPDREPPKDVDEARRRYQERVRYVTGFRYRFDGAGLLDDEPSQVWVCGLEDGETVAITDGPWDVLRPRWMPDGRIAFLSNRDEDYVSSTMVDLWAVAPTGGKPVKLTPHPGLITAYSFSRAGRCAVIASFAPDVMGGSRHQQVFVDFRSVTESLNRYAGGVISDETVVQLGFADPIWSDDGSRLHFLISDRGTSGIYCVDGGGAPFPLATGRRIMPYFSAGGSTIAYVTASAADAGTIRAANVDGSGERILHDPNAWLKSRALGETKELPIEVDGVAADGWAILPPGYSKGTKLPTLLVIHGGPHAAFGWSFQLSMQVLAAAGYAVVCCNPPGSQSYSEEFARAALGRWGDADLPYFMKVVDAAVAAGFADPDRLGVTGGSYGGFSTLWAVTHSTRFKAAVAEVPVSLLESFYGSSDIGWLFSSPELGAEPWEDPDAYRRRSPALMLEKVTTPLRLIANLSDIRTPPEQAEQVYVRLKKMGKVVDLVLFHGESHQLPVIGKPWNRVRRLRALQEWFDRYLKTRA